MPNQPYQLIDDYDPIDERDEDEPFSPTPPARPRGRRRLGISLRDRLMSAVRKSPLRRVPDGALGALAVIAVLLFGAALWHWWPSGPDAGITLTTASATSRTTAPSAAAAAPSAAAASSQGANRTAELVVDVAGAVANPGVYRLPEGSRVVDAVEAAGGPVEDAATAQVNLARLLKDGEQVYLPSSDGGALPGASAGGDARAATSGGDESGGLVDINAATSQELEALPGIGPSTAAKIVADRETNGPFSSKEDLQRVSGIGEKKYAALADSITVSP
ncbi:MAG: helix-hairpin-helix domain-containing protein [Coriobacteriales bacterium]|nr:helix-hairpin-helix domain-containing protein [Coriobacteriales bacterium]